MIAAGLLNKQIAFELNVSEATIKAHMTAIMRKLHVSNRTQVALLRQPSGARASAASIAGALHGIYVPAERLRMSRAPALRLLRCCCCARVARSARAARPA